MVCKLRLNSIVNESSSIDTSAIRPPKKAYKRNLDIWSSSNDPEYFKNYSGMAACILSAVRNQSGFSNRESKFIR